MPLSKPHLELLEQLRAIPDSQERMAKMVQYARACPSLPESLQSEANRVPGCTAKLWWVPRFENGVCHFQCDSDSMVVKGIASLICESLSGLSPREIVSGREDVLETIGIRHHLTSSRRNGLGQIRGRIVAYAQSRIASHSPTPQGSALFDAHNHLQDARFAGLQDQIVAEAQSAGVVRMVVNGTCEEDWHHVSYLCRRHPCLVPSFGYHPWYLHKRTPDWKESLASFLTQNHAGVGEIGLDRWMPHPDDALQEEAFLWQWRLACDLRLPISIHCLNAWGRLEALLRSEVRAPRGFLLHSYGGPPEMIASFAKLGAYFGFPGSFLHERKLRQRETFRNIPKDLLMLESDAPDQLPPQTFVRFKIGDNSLISLHNHPGNLGLIVEGLAKQVSIPVTELAVQLGSNFKRLFGG